MEEAHGRTWVYGMSEWNRKQSKAFKNWKVRHKQGAEERYGEEEREIVRQWAWPEELN